MGLSHHSQPHAHAGQLQQLLDAWPPVQVRGHHQTDQLPQLRGKVLGEAGVRALVSQLFPQSTTFGKVGVSRHLKHGQTETKHVPFLSELGAPRLGGDVTPISRGTDCNEEIL